MKFCTRVGLILTSVAFTTIPDYFASPTALAATYFAGDDANLRDAIDSANADADPVSTVVLNQNVELIPTNLPTSVKPLFFSTGAFTLSGDNFFGGAVRWDGAGGLITVSGNFKGGDNFFGISAGTGLDLSTSASAVSNAVIVGGQSNLTGGAGAGLYFSARLTNNASVTGGASPRGGIGAYVWYGSQMINNGTITGGAGPDSGGDGLELRYDDFAVNIGQRSTLINNGLIQGGSSTAGPGGSGVLAGRFAGTIVNNGTIKGGAGDVGGGAGILVDSDASQITNTGLIEGGPGAMAIEAVAPDAGLDIINSGAIKAGLGQATAIRIFEFDPTGSLALELRPGSLIDGFVLANPTATTDLLRLAGTGSWTLPGGIGDNAQYQFFDRVEKTGPSTWTVEGSGSFTGPTDILAGTLIMNGALAASPVTVRSGAVLGGNGTVGAAVLEPGSQIAPGTGVGTLTINGNFSQGSGAIYQAQLDPATGNSDLIRVNGIATLATGALLSVSNSSGAPFIPGQIFTVLSANGVVGSYNFGEVVLTPFLSLKEGYDGSSAYLTVIQTGTLDDVVATPNEKGVNGSVPQWLLFQLLNQGSVLSARQALNQLSGEIHATGRTVLLEESWLVRSAMNDRLRTASGSRETAQPGQASWTRGGLTVWGQGYGYKGTADGDGNAGKATRSAAGVLFGADIASGNAGHIGLLAGYSRSTFDVNSRQSFGTSDNYHLGAYGGGRIGAIHLRAGASHTWHELATRRTLAATAIGGGPRATYGGSTSQLFGEAGYRIALRDFSLEPFAGLALVRLSTDYVQESGATEALSGAQSSMSLGFSTIGLRGAANYEFNGLAVTLQAGIGWRHTVGDLRPSAQLAFAGPNAFTAAGLPVAKNAAVLEAGAHMQLNNNAKLSLSYTGQIGQQVRDHSFKGVVAVAF